MKSRARSRRKSRFGSDPNRDRNGIEFKIGIEIAIGSKARVRNNLPSAVFSEDYDKGGFNKRPYSFVKGRQRISDARGQRQALVWRLRVSMGGGDHLLSGDSPAADPRWQPARRAAGTGRRGLCNPRRTQPAVRAARSRRCCNRDNRACFPRMLHCMSFYVYGAVYAQAFYERLHYRSFDDGDRNPDVRCIIGSRGDDSVLRATERVVRLTQVKNPFINPPYIYTSACVPNCDDAFEREAFRKFSEAIGNTPRIQNMPISADC
ncbi:hypothetical protein EVAR_10503_1 [Eumeta japonica]|uniref:Uncharacterized protein n=1 Tax=Eumeta variegata TaxID=151549 RepID=A0A4C1TKV1_EUMVA|nr:hypothetical protein EVAR_10503_1 [Eumeta japonica]